MKICVLTNMHAPNDDRIYFKQVLSLAKRYPDITIVAPANGNGNPDLQQPIKFIPLRTVPGKLGRLFSIITAIGIIRNLQPDVVHFHDLYLILAVPLLRFLTRARLIYDSHEAYPETVLISPHIPASLRGGASLLVNAIEKHLARFCHLIITADDPTRDTFSEKGLPATTIFNYPPLHIFKKNDAFEEQLQQQYAGRTVIIYQGTAGKDRGLNHMIEAMAILKEKVPSILLLIVGLNQPSLRADTDRLIAECGVSDHIEIIPWVEHLKIASYMRIARIGLIPWQPVAKHMKNIPIKVFEYMACGLPVLGANTPPIKHYLKASGAGRVYDSTDLNAMAENVCEMLADQDELQRMRHRGLHAVNMHWNWQKMEERLLKSYLRLGSKHESPVATNQRSAG